ncbi:barstar family protein [Dyadobacter sp. CY345]|uniref:barstar family protein n=1 Tax=Dyadobacter sp. CY345 TaxID=2909335 RepID=UPI001F47AD9D|nr:barstar family protein [Dyadobacter sp. CY345]MCF2445422.1 barstar family protein [Dyadobacter sp. CY345]
MKKEIFINGSSVKDIATFYEEINRIFMSKEDWTLGCSLDAFNDLLYGGFGIIKGKEPIKLVWLDSNQSREALGYQTTKLYYEEKLKPNSRFNKEMFQEKLAALENGTGETYFDIILSIISEHENIELDLK